MPSPPNYVQHQPIPTPAMDSRGSALVPASSSYASDEKRKKVPRPPNAFMLFRSWLIRHGELPPEVEKHQQKISKIAGKVWGLLNQSSKDVWHEMAHQRLRDHERDYPNYKFDPSPKGSRAGLKRLRKVADNSEEGDTRRLGASPDNYARDHRAAGTRRPRRERPSPYKFPVTESTPRGPVGGHLLSPLPLDPQQPTFTQGTMQQPPPCMFLPPGLPNHFEQAYQQGDGVGIFASFAQHAGD